MTRTCRRCEKVRDHIEQARQWSWRCSTPRRGAARTDGAAAVHNASRQPDHGSDLVAGVVQTARKGRLAGHRGRSFHALRHFFATTQISQHVEPQEVQRALRHKTLTMTLETFVHW